MQIVNLRVGNMVRPFGQDERHPLFSWNVQTDARGWMQAACRVTVGVSEAALDAGNNLLWDSGRVETPLPRLRYSGASFSSDTPLYWRVQVWPQGGGSPAHSQTEWFHIGLLQQTEWQGSWLGEAEDGPGHLWRGCFTVAKPVASARLFICGLGHYEAHLNGARVGDRVLEPGWTAYDKTLLYSAYDVTELLAEGGNSLGILLADGMFNVPANSQGRHVYFERSYGKMKLLVQLNITLADGASQSFVTGADWRMAPNAYDFCGVYGGEDVDLRREQPDFSCPNFDDNAWQKATPAPPPQGRLCAQMIPPCKVMQVYPGKRIGTPNPHAVVYDFGTNFSGWPKITLRGGAAGAGVRLYPAELLGEDGQPNQSLTQGGFWWALTLDGRAKTEWTPRFSYYGFRYLLVEGVSPDGVGSLPFVKAVEGQFVHPDVEPGGAFRCSNPLFNQIHNIVRQAMLSNMKSYLTDCPHREKLPWMEQTHLIGPGLLYNFDLLRLYGKIMQDIADTQYADGLIPDICPQYVKFGYHRGFNDSPEWGSAGVMNPWYVYNRYGEPSLLKRHYNAMARYVDYLTSQAHHHVLHHGLGDWLDVGPFPTHSQNTPVPVIATCMYHLDIQVMEKTARLLGKPADAARWAALGSAVRGEFRAQFLDKQATRAIWVANGSQAAQAMALMCGLIDEDEAALVFGGLVEDIQRRGWATTAGDVGHPFVLAALVKYGRPDVMARMLMDTEKPGYGFQVANGATTLTEDWDGPDPKRPHGSQNHFMLGAVEEWFAAGLAGFGGIREENEGSVLRVAPGFVAECDEVNAWTLHPCGRVGVAWRRGVNGITVELAVPPGLEVRFAAAGAERLLGSGAHRFIVADPAAES